MWRMSSFFTSIAMVRARSFSSQLVEPALRARVAVSAHEVERPPAEPARRVHVLDREQHGLLEVAADGRLAPGEGEESPDGDGVLGVIGRRR
jgi:hypothetical protein